MKVFLRNQYFFILLTCFVSGHHFLPARISVSKSYNFFSISERQIQNILMDYLEDQVPSKIGLLSRHLTFLCERYQFDPAFILALIHVESRFRTHVISPAGAMGLMQLMPTTAEEIARNFRISYQGPHSLLEPMTNLSIGVAYLSFLREKYQGAHPYYPMAAYLMGPKKLNELVSRNHFKPDKSKKYYESILRQMSAFRFYTKPRA